MGVERHGILLAVDMRRVPGRLDERIGGQAHRLHVGVGDLGQDALAHSQRKARGVIGHDVRTLADRRRGLHLGVEGRAPVERRPLNLDLARVFGVEVFDELLHAHAVAAAQEVPPHDGFLGSGHARHQRDGRRRGIENSSDHFDFLPKMTWRLPACQALGSGTARLGKPRLGMVARKTRGAKHFQSANLILIAASVIETPPRMTARSPAFLQHFRGKKGAAPPAGAA